MKAREFFGEIAKMILNGIKFIFWGWIKKIKDKL